MNQLGNNKEQILVIVVKKFNPNNYTLKLLIIIYNIPKINPLSSVMIRKSKGFGNGTF
jgi:hypothetical protein